MKLTNEELTFIDKYLQKSDVIYYDIRIELIDHIAEAVEAKMATGHQSFYDAFKDYMAVNKKHLINQKRFAKTAKRYTLQFFKNVFLRPITLLFAITAYLIVQFIFGNWNIDTLNMLWISNGILATIAIFQLMLRRKNKRFSGVETLSHGLTVIYNFALLILFVIETFVEKYWAINMILQIHAVLFFTTIMTYVVAEYQLRKLYSKRFSYESLA